MNKLYKAVTRVVAVVVATWGIAVQADDHLGKAAPVDFWSCTFKEGSDRGDLEKAIEGFNKWAKAKGQEANYDAWVLTPQYYDAGLTFDYGWLGTWPDAKAYGAFSDEFWTTGTEVFAGFMDMSDCASHQMASSLEIDVADEGPGDRGFVLFSRCTVADGKTGMDAVEAHMKLAEAFKGAPGNANSWLFFPGAGAGPGIDFHYWSVLGFSSYSNFAAAWDNYINGNGWKKMMATMEGVAQCAAGTAFDALRVTK